MKKKILFVASEFASGMIPFAATAINALAKDDRFEVHCLCVNSGIYSYRNIILQEANPVFLEYPKSKMMKLFYKLWPLEIIKHLSQLEKSINPDAVHFLTGDFTLALYICLNNKRTFYYTVHDLHPHEVVRKTLLGYLMQKYIIWGYKLCRNIIPNLTTSSYFQLKELKEIYPYKKVKYTSFPSLITSLIINGKKMPLEVSGLKEYILFFGTVDKYKGVDLLVDAYCNLTCKSLKLVIAGRGFDIETHNENIIRINRFIEDEETVRDIIQECFLRFWERREMLSAFSLTSLLFSMVRNGCLNYLKHRSIVEKYRVEYLAKVDGEERLYYADFMQDAEHKLLYKELQEQIALVLNQLPDRSREIFLLSRFRGLKNREIAEKLQISTTAVEKHIARALQYFSRHFSERYPVDLYIVILAWLMMEQK